MPVVEGVNGQLKVLGEHMVNVSTNGKSLRVNTMIVKDFKDFIFSWKVATQLKMVAYLGSKFAKV